MEIPPATEEVYRFLVESVKDYAIIMLDPTGIVLTWNPGAESIKGYAGSEIIGQHFSVFYPPEDRVAGKPDRELRTAEDEGRFEDEGWRLRKDGSRFWANVVVTAMRDKKGGLRGYSKVTRDITERTRAEELISRQAREILEVATPVIQVWEGVVVVPLIGTLDSQRTEQLMEQLLNRIVASDTRVALIDIRGVPAIDTQTAQHLIETIHAARLVGAQVVLTGIRPAIAQTLVHLGIDLSNVITRSSLVAGLRVALDSLSLEVVSKNRES